MRFIALLAIMTIMSCSWVNSLRPFPKDKVASAKQEIENLYYSDFPRYFPNEWEMLKEVWQKLDEAEKENNNEEGMRWYYYIKSKIDMLEYRLEARRAEEAVKQEQLRQEILKRLEEEKKKAEIEKNEIEAEEKQKSIQSVKKKHKKTMNEIRYKLEKRYPSFYTTSEGDSLESIAEKPTIYGDKYQWTIIYKYNRNQISNPKKLYEGQIIKIPRNITMEELYKSREEAGAKQPKYIPRKAFTPEKYKKYTEELLSED